MKWGELKAQGVKRCCAYFTDGSRCRRRATMSETEGFHASNWCDKHGPVMKAATAQALKAIAAQAKADDRELDEDD